MNDTVSIPGVPGAFTPSTGSLWSTVEPKTVRVTATARSDIFVDPAGGGLVDPAMLNAATLLTAAPVGDFQFSARVEVDFSSTYDAGVLLVWLDETHWAKLCFEFSPDGEAMIVSVVCRDVADDANAFVVDGHVAWLRVSRTGSVFAYHASLDGTHWRMIRAFALDSPGATTRLGFEAQSPTGTGCDVDFSEISLGLTTLADLRDGT